MSSDLERKATWRVEGTEENFWRAVPSASDAKTILRSSSKGVFTFESSNCELSVTRLNGWQEVAVEGGSNDMNRLEARQE